MIEIEECDSIAAAIAANGSLAYTWLGGRS